ncbi:MAG: TPM domain-containing protein [Kiritimatiellaeota bacterium]|nr:TPM domain-containing protein [Kiritimatiellota bacterium]
MKRFCLKLCCAAVTLLLACAGHAAETLPPAPAHYFNDYAGVVDAAVAQQLNIKLDTFERATSCQIVVAVFPKMPDNSALEDYTLRVAQSWRVGQKLKKNGCVLFVFIQDRRMRIEVGYGLEGALPDALAKRIIEDEIKPHFKTGDYAAGLSAGVAAILKATRGEYKGTGKTIADSDPVALLLNHLPLILFFAFVLSCVIFSNIRRPRGTVYHRGGGTYWGGSTWGGGGGWSSGGSDFGGGGGFSGGGGSFGGGGASGSW